MLFHVIIMEGLHSKYVKHDPFHTSPKINILKNGIENARSNAIVCVVWIGMVKIMDICIEAYSYLLKGLYPTWGLINVSPFMKLIG